MDLRFLSAMVQSPEWKKTPLGMHIKREMVTPTLSHPQVPERLLVHKETHLKVLQAAHLNTHTDFQITVQNKQKCYFLQANFWV